MAIINAQNRPPQHARAHKLLNDEVVAHCCISKQSSICITPNFHRWTYIMIVLWFLPDVHWIIPSFHCRNKKVHVSVVSCKAGFFFFSIHVAESTRPCAHEQSMWVFSSLGRSHHAASSPSSITIIIALHLLPFHISKPTSVPLFPHPFALFPLLSSAQTSHDG